MKDEFRDQYVESLKEKIDTIDTLETKFHQGLEFADQNIRILAHALHGSGATFGFPAITRASAVLEQAREEDLVPRMLDLKKILEKIVTGYAAASRARVHTDSEQPKIDKADDESLVLVIENDPATADQVKACLADQPGKIRTVTAADAMAAEEQLLRGDYDLVILDLVLPDRDGRELLQEIKIYFRMQVPVIVLSGITKDVVRIDCISLGADRYLTKPLDTDKLGADIAALLAGEAKVALSLVPLDETPTSAPAADESGPLSGMTILVADDDEQLGQLICHLMTDQGAAVEYARDGHEAIDILRSTRCHLVILDLTMPELDGFGVVEKIRGDMDLKGLPVILLTALGGETDILRGYDMGVNDYLIKPISEVYLVARVKSLLRHH